MTFHSKIDIWLLLVFIFVIATSVLAIVTLAMRPNFQQSWVPIAISIVLGIGFPISAIFATYYSIDDNKLFIRSSIFTWEIPIEDIQTVKEQKVLTSSPALSMDRILITYRGGQVAISPKQKSEFLHILNEKMAKIKLD